MGALSTRLEPAHEPRRKKLSTQLDEINGRIVDIIRHHPLPAVLMPRTKPLVQSSSRYPGVSLHTLTIVLFLRYRIVLVLLLLLLEFVQRSILLQTNRI